MKIVIVGGVAGGASAAARARRLDESAEIIIFERGEYVSFANCGLPYYVGGEIEDRDALLLQTPESLGTRFKLDVRSRSEVVSIDRGKREVEVRDLDLDRTYRETYDKLILSPGAAPVVPPLPGAELERVYTVRTVPDAVRIRKAVDLLGAKRALVVGGGFIGLEMAENLTHAGLEVTLVEMLPQVMPPADEDLACYLHRELREHGVGLRLSTRLEAIEEIPGNSYMCRLSDGSTAECDMVVLSVGVRPEVSLAREAGLEIGDSGGIRVDEHLRTSDKHIYAVGDAIENRHRVTGESCLIPLAGPANRQGRIVADNILGPRERSYRGAWGTSIVRVFGLTLGHTGASEKRLAAAGIPFLVSWTHRGSHAGYYPGSARVSMKILFSPKDGRLLGAQAVGRDGVDKRIDVMATALAAGMTVEDLTELELAYAPPFGSAKDPVNIAGYTASNIMAGLVENVHWNELEGRKQAFLLDVRRTDEFADGHIDGAVNIPVDELRHRMDEVPDDRPVDVYCRTGFRSYLACRILTQNGREGVRNLSGGWLTWAASMEK